MKKVFGLILSIILSALFLFACGKSGKKETIAEHYNLYSNDTRLVFQDNSELFIYYINGEEVVGAKIYRDYNSADYAIMFCKNNKADELEDVSMITRDGQYVIFVMEEGYYENETITSLKEFYEGKEIIKES